ncbi:hypothetical protein F5X97DRAFT_257207 [Nemania serpens]|nr:hypothetical protein F5X97DRAFT_257207 [Nemania serpens]
MGSTVLCLGQAFPPPALCPDISSSSGARKRGSTRWRTWARTYRYQTQHNSYNTSDAFSSSIQPIPRTTTKTTARCIRYHQSLSIRLCCRLLQSSVVSCHSRRIRARCALAVRSPSWSPLKGRGRFSRHVIGVDSRGIVPTCPLVRGVYISVTT